MPYIQENPVITNRGMFFKKVLTTSALGLNSYDIVN